LEPARASPIPSSSDFLPSSMTSDGMSPNFVSAIKPATYLVSPRVAGNGGEQDCGLEGSAAFAAAGPRKPIPALTPTELLKKSRLFIQVLMTLDNVSRPLMLQWRGRSRLASKSRGGSAAVPNQRDCYGLCRG